MDPRDSIIVALDTNAAQARELALSLRGVARWLKVGMTLFASAGPEIINEFKELGFKVFVDLKLHDIPHQVEGATQALAEAGADMLTVHAAGGLEMMQAASEGVRAGHKSSGSPSRAQRPLCLAITVLTSLDQRMLKSIGVSSNLEAQVMRMAALAGEAAMDGVVCSPQEVAALRVQRGDAFTLVTPGVRPQGSQKGDQSRVATPAEALAAGADYLVIGRPITQADDPVQALEAIIGEMQA